MAKIKLKWDELVEVVDAGLIVLGYTKDRSHNWVIGDGNESLKLDEPNTYKKKTKPDFVTRDIAFRNHSSGSYINENDLPAIRIQYDEPPGSSTSARRALAALTVGSILGLVGYNIITSWL